MPAARKPPHDIEEILPGRFVVHNPRAKGIIKGEGRMEGRLFVLTSWRRAGLLARLEAHGMAALTLDDRVASLPLPPEPAPIGAATWRPLAPNDRFSFFDPAQLAWATLNPEERDGAPGVLLRNGWALRRRTGRGPASYYLAGAGTIRAVDEDTALLAGLARAARTGRPKLLARRAGDKLLLPQVELPRPYREFLNRLGRRTPEGFAVDEHGWPLAESAFARLGLRLELEPTSST